MIEKLLATKKIKEERRYFRYTGFLKNFLVSKIVVLGLNGVLWLVTQ